MSAGEPCRPKPTIGGVGSCLLRSRRAAKFTMRMVNRYHTPDDVAQQVEAIVTLGREGSSMGRRLESDRGGYFRQAGPAWFRRGLTKPAAGLRPCMRMGSASVTICRFRLFGLYTPQRWSNRRIFVPPELPPSRPQCRSGDRRLRLSLPYAGMAGRFFSSCLCEGSGDCSFCARGDREFDRQPEPVQEDIAPTMVWVIGWVGLSFLHRR